MNGIVFFDKNSTFNKIGVEGVIKFHQCKKGTPTTVQIELKNLPPNVKRAIHIHEFGNISGGCMTAGAHYNPYNKVHGCIFINRNERHAGDLVNNIIPDKDGKVNLTYEDNLVSLFGENSVIGRTVVIHEKADDLGLGGNAESLKTGNAGGRVACAIIGIDKKDHI